MAVTLSTIAPDALETREIADLSAEISSLLTTSLAAAINGNGGTAPTGAQFTNLVVSLTATLNAGVLVALANARGLNYNIA